MDPLGFNPAAPFPAPPTTAFNLGFPLSPMATLHYNQLPSVDHPRLSYPEMIKAAIRALNDASGSSKEAISRYIEETYSNLPPTHSQELAAWLQALTSAGELVQLRNCFTFPGFTMFAHFAAPAPAVPTGGGGSAHRKRGRPRKPKPTTEPNFGQSVEPVNEANDPPTTDRTFGENAEPVNEANDRPTTELNFGQSVESVNEANDVQGKAAEVVPKKRPGRQVKKVDVEGSNGAVEKKRGRPKKNKKVVFSGPMGYPKRGPGRPPKSRSVADVSNGPVKTSAFTGVKKGGSPKRSVGDGQEPKVVKLVGWHPTKEVGSRFLGPINPQWMVDYAHVRAKIGYIQSKMQKAIEVIKPHLMNQVMTNGHLGTALQELDQISTMDVMAVSLMDPDDEPEPTEEM